MHVNCGSPDMIDQLGERAPGSSITLRINPGFGHGHSQKTNTGGEQSKHGIWHDAAGRMPAAGADHHGLAVTGLHMHIGSGTDLEHLAQVCGALEKAARDSRPLADRRSAPAAACRSPIAPGRPTSISTLISDCGTPPAAGWKTRSATSCGWRSSRAATWSPRAATWSTEIRAIKQMGHNTFYLVDAGFNNLARPILYGAYHPMSIVPADDWLGAAGGR